MQATSFLHFVPGNDLLSFSDVIFSTGMRTVNSLHFKSQWLKPYIGLYFITVGLFLSLFITVDILSGRISAFYRRRRLCDSRTIVNS